MIETLALVVLAQWAVLGPLVAMKYVFNSNNKNDNRASAQTGGRVHGRN